MHACRAETCLDELEKMRGHPVWGKALALIGVDGWSSDLKLVKDFQDHLRNAAADPLLDKEILQRLQITFLKPQNKQPEVSSLWQAPAVRLWCRTVLYCAYLGDLGGPLKTADLAPCHFAALVPCTDSSDETRTPGMLGPTSWLGSTALTGRDSCGTHLSFIPA